MIQARNKVHTRSTSVEEINGIFQRDIVDFYHKNPDVPNRTLLQTSSLKETLK